MKHTVTIGVTVQAYAQIEVEAASLSEAMTLVDLSIEKTGWDSPFWINATFKPDWAGADGLRVVGMDDLRDEVEDAEILCLHENLTR